MNRTQLIELIRRLNIDRRSYSFDRKEPPEEGYVLEHVGSRSVVYYFERGGVRNVADFESDFDACDFFYEQLRKMAVFLSDASATDAGAAKHTPFKPRR